MEEEVKVKTEPNEDDYTYEYEGAPSPDAPIFELIPLESIFAKAGPSYKRKKHTFEDPFEDTNRIGESSSYFFNMEKLERQYTSFKKMNPHCQNDVSGNSFYVPDTRTVKLVQDKSTQCSCEYVPPNYKVMKDASTETSALFPDFYYGLMSDSREEPMKN